MDPNYSTHGEARCTRCYDRREAQWANRVNQRDTINAIRNDIGVALGFDKSQPWKRRNDAAHGLAMEDGEELDVIRDIKVLKIMFHRILLRIVNGADSYHEYATPGFPIRKLRPAGKIGIAAADSQGKKWRAKLPAWIRSNDLGRAEIIS